MCCNVNRFLEPSNRIYEIALAEIKRGKKQSHWIWFIFPQIKGLGKTSTSEYYGIKNLEEAKEFLDHPILGKRLLEITEALLEIEDSPAIRVFESPDYLKLKSCMTLFKLANPETNVFQKVLCKYYNGFEDELTKEKINYLMNQ
jgi:uncharacterized protein (DUF1810 family)